MSFRAWLERFLWAALFWFVSCLMWISVGRRFKSRPLFVQAVRGEGTMYQNNDSFETAYLQPWKFFYLGSANKLWHGTRECEVSPRWHSEARGVGWGGDMRFGDGELRPFPLSCENAAWDTQWSASKCVCWRHLSPPISLSTCNVMRLIINIMGRAIIRVAPKLQDTPVGFAIN